MVLVLASRCQERKVDSTTYDKHVDASVGEECHGGVMAAGTVDVVWDRWTCISQH